MYIKRLEIKGFGKLKNHDIELCGGLNVIYGCNESGKSTLQGFIKAVLYGLKGGRVSKEGVLPPVKRYKPWNIDQFKGSIEYMLDSGEAYRIQRNFQNGEINVFDSKFNNINEKFEIDGKKNLLAAQKHLGISEQCFEKTAFIEQMKTSGGISRSSELESRLINAMETGYEDTSFQIAEKCLGDTLKDRIGTGKTSTKPLDLINSEIQSLLKKKEGLFKKNADMLKIMEGCKALKEERKIALEKMAAIKGIFKLLAKYGDFENMKQKLAELKKISDNVVNLNKEFNKNKFILEQAEASIDESAVFSNYSSSDVIRMQIDIEKMYGLDKEWGEIRKEISNAEKNKSELLKYFELKEGPCDAKFLNKKLAELMNELSVLENEGYGDKVKRAESYLQKAKRKKKIFGIYKIVMGLLTVLTLVSGFAGVRYGFFATVPMAAAFCYLSIMTGKMKKDILVNEGEHKHLNSKNMENDRRLNAVKAGINSIYSKTGVDSYEDFVRQTAKNEAVAQKLEYEEEKLKNLKMKETTCRQKINDIMKMYSKMLVECGIISCPNELPCIGKIKKFVERINAIEFNLTKTEHLKDKLTHLEQLRSGMYEKAGNILKKAITDADAVIDGVKDFEARLEKNDTSHNINKFNMSPSIKDKILSDIICEIKKDKKLETERLESRLSEYEAYISRYINDKNFEINKMETLIDNYNPGEEIQYVEERLAELNERASILSEKASSLNIAMEVLKASADYLKSNFAPILRKKLNENISRITSSRYLDLRADDNLDLRVKVPETKEIIGVMNLSGGTVEQMYLAMRIAMIQVIEMNNEKIPLFLDEIFAQYDDNRIKSTLKILSDMSKDRQILLFTCKQREVELACRYADSNVNLVNMDTIN